MPHHALDQETVNQAILNRLERRITHLEHELTTAQEDIQLLKDNCTNVDLHGNYIKTTPS